MVMSFSFFFNDTATTEIYTLSLHDALPIWGEAELTLISELSLTEDLDDQQLQRLDENLAPMERAFLDRSEEHTSELQSRLHLVCRLLLEKKNKQKKNHNYNYSYHNV